MRGDDYLVPDSITVEHSADDDLLLTIHMDILKGERVCIRLEPAAALEFMRNVTNHVSYAAPSWASRIYIGDCATCGNSRLVDITKHGRTEKASCPDCNERRLASQPFPPRPRVGGGER